MILRRRGLFSASTVSGTTALNLLTILCGVGSGVTLARTLGPEGRGQFAAALLWPGLFVLFADMGLGFAFAYGSAKWKDRLDELWTLSLVMGTALGGLALVVGWLLLARLTGNSGSVARQGMGTAFFSIPFILITGYTGFLFLGIQKVAEYNAVRIVSPLANMVSVLLVAACGRAGVIFYARAYLATQVISFVFCSALFVIRQRPRFRLSFNLMSPLFSYAVRTQLGSLAGQANLRLDQSVMSLWVVPEKLGLYVVAVSISGIAAPLMNALAVMALPRTAHAPSCGGAGLVVASHVKQALVMSVPLSLLWILMMPVILIKFFGPSYGPAVISAQILTLAATVEGLNTILGNSLRGLGRPGLSGISEGAGMAITIALLYFLLPRWGIAGASITSLCAYSLVAILQFLFVARTAGLSLGGLMRNVWAYDSFDLLRRFRKVPALR